MLVVVIITKNERLGCILYIYILYILFFIIIIYLFVYLFF